LARRTKNDRVLSAWGIVVSRWRQRSGQAALIAAMTVIASGASAQGDDIEDESREVEVHGFVSQGFIKSTANNYLAYSERGSFEFSEAGLNVTKVLGDRLRVGVQLFTRDLGPIGNYQATFDWFYLDYRLADWLGVRAGRTKLPWGLYNEVSDVDAARVPALLPQAIYPIRSRNYLLAQTGIELYGFLPIGPVGGIEYRVYGGTIFLDQPATAGGFKLERLNVPYLVGGRLMWETPFIGLRTGGSVQALRLDYDLSGPSLVGQPGAPKGIASVKVPVVLWVLSVEYTGPNLLLAAEYGRWHVKIEDEVPAILPPAKAVSERLYVMGSYRIGPWFTPGVYYSLYYVDVEKRKGRQNFQHDAAATLRFDVSPHWLVKLEGHYMRGTADLTSDLNSGTPTAELDKLWKVLLVKTTVYF
jgi:hypothetical protein